jgi:hypothetical protein
MRIFLTRDVVNAAKNAGIEHVTIQEALATREGLSLGTILGGELVRKRLPMTGAGETRVIFAYLRSDRSFVLYLWTKGGLPKPDEGELAMLKEYAKVLQRLDLKQLGAAEEAGALEEIG